MRAVLKKAQVLQNVKRATLCRELHIHKYIIIEELQTSLHLAYHSPLFPAQEPYDSIPNFASKESSCRYIPCFAIWSSTA